LTVQRVPRLDLSSFSPASGQDLIDKGYMFLSLGGTLKTLPPEDLGRGNLRNSSCLPPPLRRPWPAGSGSSSCDCLGGDGFRDRACARWRNRLGKGGALRRRTRSRAPVSGGAVSCAWRGRFAMVSSGRREAQRRGRIGGGGCGANAASSISPSSATNRNAYPGTLRRRLT